MSGLSTNVEASLLPSVVLYSGDNQLRARETSLLFQLPRPSSLSVDSHGPTVLEGSGAFKCQRLLVPGWLYNKRGSW